MKKKSSSSSRKIYKVKAEDAALFAMDLQLGGNVARPPATLTSAEVPKDIQRAQKVAFNHFQDNFIVRPIVLGKMVFFNYGCQILVKGKPVTTEMISKWQAKWDEYGEKCNGFVVGKVMDAIHKYIKSVWQDELVYDSIVSLWRPGGFYPLPFTIQPQRCIYTNACGNHKLKVELDWDKKDLPTEGNNFVMGQRAQDVSKDMGLNWKVSTKGNFGYGFGRPGMASVFRALGQCVSMEAGESLIGYIARSPLRQHQIGHETRYGPFAGGTQNFYNKRRKDAISKFMKGTIGFAEFVSNFDHKMVLHWVDPKWYDSTKWSTIIDRLVWWAQSFGFMYITKSINPYLFPIFQNEAESERQEIKEHVEAMLSLALDADDLELKWSNECFSDQRLAFEMMKFLITQGPLSLTTGLRKSGYDPATEFELKTKEAGMNKKKVFPLFDASHGTPPGRPPGTRDPE